MNESASPRLDWDGLRFFLAAERAGSLAAAARALAVDKATVSRRISDLEATLGVRLFDRKPSGFALTADGARVRTHALRVDAELAELGDELTGGAARGPVRVTVPAWFACEVLLPEVPAFRREHPGVELVVDSSSRVRNLAQREAEVGLRNARPPHLSGTARRAGRLASALYGSRDYLRRHGVPATEDGLSTHDLIAYERTISFLPAFAWLSRFEGRVVLRGDDAMALIRAVAAGLGLAVLPCFLGDRHPGLTRLAVGGLAGEDIWVVTPGERRRGHRVAAVIDLLVGLFRRHADALAGRG